MYMRHFLAEITNKAHPSATPIYVDNSACVSLALYIPTSKNTADALTKPLAKHKFLEHRNLIVRESAAWGGVKADKPP